MGLWEGAGALDEEQGARKGRVGEGQTLLFPGPPRHSPDLEEEIICGNEGLGCGGHESPRPGHSGAQMALCRSARMTEVLTWRREAAGQPLSPPSSLALC